MDKDDAVYTVEYCSAIKRMNATYSNIDGPGRQYDKGEICQRQILHYNTHMWDLKRPNKLVNTIEEEGIHKCREQTSNS